MGRWAHNIIRIVWTLDIVDVAVLRGLILLHRIKKSWRHVSAVIFTAGVGFVLSACQGAPVEITAVWLAALIILAFLLVLAFILFRK
jgi:hypothetical protein